MKWHGKELKINVELIPLKMHKVNLRSELPEYWDFLRKLIYKRANYRCEICGGKGPKWPVEAHELWKYDEINGIMAIDKIVALCPDCHLCHHLGFANATGKIEYAKSHLAKVNGFSNEECEQYVEEVFEKWIERNNIDWKLDIEKVKKFCEEVDKRKFNKNKSK